MLRITAVFMFLFLGLFSGAESARSSDISAAPVSPVVLESMPSVQNHVTFVELFSSQNCVFCHKADNYFNELVKRPHVLGVSCHVDYFDHVRESLSQPFCTQRQSDYVPVLGDGPAYTPQIVINGAVGIVGYKHKDVEMALVEQSDQPAQRLSISLVQDKSTTETPADTGNTMTRIAVEWPEGVDNEEKNELSLWAGIYDQDHMVIMKNGPDAGKERLYPRVLSEIKQLGVWAAHFEERAEFEIPVRENHKGVVILLQNPETGRILAAGEYIL